MNKALERDMMDASDATEHLLKRLPEMSMDEKIDVAARLRAIAKNCESIDKLIKDEITQKLKGKPGTVMGDVFKASLAMIPTTRFDQTAFKGAHPDLYDKWTVTKDQQRITFEPR